ncbi:hypothetical protein SAMN06265795_101233 [Noviherbaspirillum humi]|uniref:Serine aminopeptidase S33 domain-containing protein n=1 Tax=Noviherbaspirillum humi TaxID=1688639 RepID=A0A239C3Z0_9BURK|nr:alpha/beta fold hydrolase [Noviherbaspirillum humi]SNS14622.1 hypothetical protein SAMN06265795_101233 [Noviherbaspirillum humi]
MLLLVPLLVVAGLYLGQDRLILQPDFRLPSWQAMAEPAELQPWLEQGRYLGKVLEASGPARGTAVLFHGNAGHVDHRLPLAKQLAGRGLRVVLVEYPGFGRREGSAGINPILEAAQADFMLALRRWPGPVFVVGESLGAGVAAQVIRSHPDQVAGALLVTPWSSLAALAREKAGHLPVDWLLHQRLDSAEALTGYGGRLVILGAGRDGVIPVEHARALARALPHAAYLEVAEANHNTWLAHIVPAQWDSLFGALLGER